MEKYHIFYIRKTSDCGRAQYNYAKKQHLAWQKAVPQDVDIEKKLNDEALHIIDMATKICAEKELHYPLQNKEMEVQKQQQKELQQETLKEVLKEQRLENAIRKEVVLRPEPGKWIDLSLNDEQLKTSILENIEPINNPMKQYIGCCLIKMSQDEVLPLFHEIKARLNGQNGMILHNNTLYYADYIKQEIKEIVVTEGKEDSIDRLKQCFLKINETYKEANEKEHKLISVVTDSTYHFWKYGELYASKDFLYNNDGRNDIYNPYNKSGYVILFMLDQGKIKASLLCQEEADKLQTALLDPGRNLATTCWLTTMEGRSYIASSKEPKLSPRQEKEKTSLLQQAQIFNGKLGSLLRQELSEWVLKNGKEILPFLQETIQPVLRVNDSHISELRKKILVTPAPVQQEKRRLDKTGFFSHQKKDTSIHAPSLHTGKASKNL